MTARVDTIDKRAIRERQARRNRMARGAAGMNAIQFAEAVTEAGAVLSRERVGKLEEGVGDMADPVLLEAIANVAYDQLRMEIVNPVEWLNGSPPILPGPTRVNPGSLKRRWNTPVDRSEAPVLTLVKKVA